MIMIINLLVKKVEEGKGKPYDEPDPELPDEVLLSLLRLVIIRIIIFIYKT